MAVINSLLFSLPVGVAVHIPQVLFGPHDEVLGALLQLDSISAASVGHEKPPLSSLHSGLLTWTQHHHVKLC